jgi:hypothetical protein
MDSPSTEARLVQPHGHARATGWSSSRVRAKPTDVFAFVWDLMSRASMRSNDLVRVLDEDGDHSKLLYVQKQSPKPFTNRDFLTRVVWKTLGNGGFIIATIPETSDSRLESSHHFVRARFVRNIPPDEGPFTHTRSFTVGTRAR